MLSFLLRDRREDRVVAVLPLVLELPEDGGQLGRQAPGLDEAEPEEGFQALMATGRVSLDRKGGLRHVEGGVVRRGDGVGPKLTVQEVPCGGELLPRPCNGGLEALRQLVGGHRIFSSRLKLCQKGIGERRSRSKRSASVIFVERSTV